MLVFVSTYCIIEMKYVKLLFILFLVVWCTVLWLAMVYKVALDGFPQFTCHLTNWNWTLQIIFFTSELFASVSDFTWLRIFNISFLWWITYGVTWLVFWLVFLMIYENANFFLEMSTIDGGQFPFWEVLIGNAVFHVLIAVSVLIYITFMSKYINDSVALVHWLFPKWDERLFWSFIFVLYSIFAPLIVLGIYVSFYDISVVYGITTPIGYVALIAIGISLVFSGIYTFYIVCTFKAPKSSLYKKLYYMKLPTWWHVHSDNEDQ